MKSPEPEDHAGVSEDSEHKRYVSAVLGTWRARAETEYSDARMAALEARLVEAAARRAVLPAAASTGRVQSAFRWMIDAMAGGPQMSRRLALGSGFAATLLVGVMALQVGRQSSPYALDPSLRTERLLAPTQFEARSASVESANYEIRAASPGRTSLAIAARLSELDIPFTLKTRAGGGGSLRFVAPAEIPPALEDLYRSLDIAPAAQLPVLLTITAP